MTSNRRHQNYYRTEEALIRRRERQSQHDQQWQSQQHYYDQWEKITTKFNDWTSPRYYEQHNQLIGTMQRKKQHDELLEKRRQRLRQLFIDDQTAYGIESMIKRTKEAAMGQQQQQQQQQPSTETLQELVKDLTVNEEDRRRHKAESRLYQQWRNKSVCMRDCERIRQTKDIKLSWLDQQIEKQMQKDRDDAERRRVAKEHKELLRKQQRDDAEARRQIEKRRDDLRSGLERQIHELDEKNRLLDELKRKEDDVNRLKCDLMEIRKKCDTYERMKLQRDLSLCNLKHYKLRLKEQSRLIQQDLDENVELIEELKRIDLSERIAERTKQREIQQNLNEFLGLIRQQKLLELKRDQCVNLLFDSETKAVFKQQCEQWANEEMARKRLLTDVLDEIKQQVDENLRRIANEEIEIINDNEVLLKEMHEYNEEFEGLKLDEVQNKLTRREELDQQIEVRNNDERIGGRNDAKNQEIMRINRELNDIKREEERLQREIVAIQNKQQQQMIYKPTRHTRFKLV